MPSPLSGSPQKCPHAAADSKPSYGSESQKDKVGEQVKYGGINSTYELILALWHQLTLSLVSVCISAMKSRSSLMYCLMHSMAAVVHCGEQKQFIL